MDDPIYGILSGAFRQSTVVLGFGLLLLLALRRASGALRSTVARATLVAAAAGILFSFVTGPLSSPAQESFAPIVTRPEADLAPREIKTAPPSAQNTFIAAPSSSDSTSDIVVANLLLKAPHIWLGGTILLLLWTAVGLARIRWILRVAVLHDDTVCARELCQAAERCRIRPPRLLASSCVSAPILAGILRPAIILPIVQDRPLDRKSLQALFAHEMAHLRRSDCAWLLGCGLFRALLWPQPLAWILARVQSDSAEDACDEEAVCRTLDPREYARALVHLSETFPIVPRWPAQSVGVVSRPSSLGRRVRRILAMSPQKPAPIRVAACFAAMAACGAISAFRWPMPVVFQAAPSSPRADRPASGAGPIPLAFEGLADYTAGGFSHRAQIQYDRGKYRILHLYRRGRGGPFLPSYVSIYDGQVAWEVNHDLRVARPSPTAVSNRLLEEARATSEEAVRRKYGLIDSFMPNLALANTSDSAVDFPRMFDSQERQRYKEVGRAVVAGIPCRVYERRHRPKVWYKLSSDGKAMEGDFASTQRAWVDPRTNLVLRWDFRENRGVIGRFPPTSISRRMLEFRILQRIPPDRFRLPRRVTAEIPEPFRSVSLPPGVIRKEIAGIGMGGVTRFDIENKIRGESVRQDRAKKRLELALQRGDDHRVEVERTNIRRIDELLTQLRQRLTEKPYPVPRIRQ